MSNLSNPLRHVNFNAINARVETDSERADAISETTFLKSYVVKCRAGRIDSHKGGFLVIAYRTGFQHPFKPSQWIEAKDFLFGLKA